MSLGAHVSDLEKNVARQFPFDSQVILIGILRTQKFGKFAEQQNGTKAGPINGRIRAADSKCR